MGVARTVSAGFEFELAGAKRHGVRLMAGFRGFSNRGSIALAAGTSLSSLAYSSTGPLEVKVVERRLFNRLIANRVPMILGSLKRHEGYREFIDLRL